MPPSNRSKSESFLNYKKNNTANNHNTALIGISESGTESFMSDFQAGRNSDKQTARHRGIISLLEFGDDIMAERRFDFEYDLPSDVILNIPPFLEGRAQLNLKDKVINLHHRTQNIKIPLNMG